MMVTKTFFWRNSKNQFKPVWEETVKNYPAQKLELLSPMTAIWKIIGKAIFFVKGYLFIQVLVKALEGVEFGGEITVF